MIPLLGIRLWWSALPSSTRWAIGGIALAVAVAIAWVIWLANHDSEVIERHEEKRTEAAAPASEQAAEDRAQDALHNAELRRERDDAIAKAEALEAEKAPGARATLAPTTVALNCARMRQAYPAAELAKMAAYRERCL